MKILQLTAENVKKLKVVNITPSSDFIQVTGKNASGKSSVLDCIWYALAGKDAIPGRPIRDGQERAVIRLDLGEIVVERRFNASGTTTLNVENAEGARYPSPQAMLDTLIGELSFDPLAFASMKPRDQFEELKRVAKVEIDIDKLEFANRSDTEKRKEKNKESKDLRICAEGIRFQFPDMTEPIDTNALVQQIEDAGKQNANVRSEQNHRQDIQRRLGVCAGRIEEMKELLAEEEARREDLQLQIEGFKPLPSLMDVTGLREEIRGADAKNADFRKRAELAGLIARAEKIEAESLALTQSIEARSAAKAKALESAAMPVDGLSLGDGRVFLDAVPFDQCSSAEQLRTSVAIAMAANPKLRVIRIKDGSLLDDDGLRMIAELAADNDYQVWIERVDSTGKIGIVMEDGGVRVNNDAPAELAGVAG